MGFLTYSLSAIWHGFYPGFYFAFYMIALCINTSRGVRYKVRPYFQSSAPLRVSYDVITWFLTICCGAYASVSFFVLDFWSCIYFYMYSMYFSLHIIVILTF